MSFITSTWKWNMVAMLIFCLQTQTDSLVYEIKVDDVYENFDENKNLFDFCDYLKDSQFFHPVNKKLIGKMKDRGRGKIINLLD